MSDLLPPSPFEPGSPEDLQYQSGLLRGFKEAAIATPKALTHLVPGFVAGLLSSPNAQGAEAFVPNAANGLYSAVDMAQHLVGKYAVGSDYHLPGAERASELYNNRLGPGSVASLIPASPASSPFEQKLNTFAEDAGSMGPYVGRSIINKLPLPLKAATETMLPGVVAPSAPAIGGGLGVGADLVLENLQPHEPVNSLTGSEQAPTDQLPTPPEFVPAPLPTPPIPPAAAPIVDHPIADTVDLPFDPVPPLSDPNTRMTWGMAAATGLGALALIATRKTVVNKVMEMVGRDRATLYARDSAAFNAASDEASGITGKMSGVEVPAAPLPGDAGSVGSKVKTAVADKNQILFDTIDATAPNPTAADELRYRTGLYNNNFSFDTRFRYAMETGVDPVSGISFPSVTKHFQTIERLTEPQQVLYNEARHAANELDNRLIAGSKVNLSEFDTSTLKAKVAAANTDPVVSALLDEDRIIKSRVVDILQARGMITGVEATKLKNTHPNYLSSHSLSGEIDNPLAARNVTEGSGIPNANIPAWQLDKQHYEHLYRQIEKNDVVSNIISNILDSQSSNPGNAKLVREWKSPTGANRVEPPTDTMPVRINGELRHFYVENPALFKALEMSPTAIGGTLNFVNGMRQFMQSMLTGIPAAVVSRFYAPINAFRTGLEGAITRPTDMTGGYLEKALKSVSGGKITFADPTAALTWPSEVLAGVGAEFSHHLAHTLDPVNKGKFNSTLRNLLGDTRVNAIHTNLQAAWENSIRAEMQRVGASNVGGMSTAPVPEAMKKAPTKSGAPEQVIYSALNSSAPHLFQANGMFPTLKPYMLQFNEFLHGINSIISEAGNAQFFRLNKDAPALKRAYETRQLVGDPGTSGANRAVDIYNKSTVFGNVTTQGLFRVLRAFNEQPIATTMGLATVLGTGAMASIYSALLHGPEAMADLANQTRSDQAGKIKIYIPGQDPQNAAQLSLPQELRPFMGMITSGLLDAYSALDAHHDEDIGSMLWNGFKQFFNGYIKQSAVDATVTGISQFATPPMPIGADVIGSVASGRSIDPTIERIYDNWNRPTEDKFSQAGSSGIRLPGHEAVDPMFDTQSNKVFSQLYTSVLGVVGQSLAQYVGTARNAYRDTESYPYAASNLLEDYKLNVTKNNPMLNGLAWEAHNRLATNTPLIARTTDALEAMKPLLTFGSDTKNDGLTRSKGELIPSYSDPKFSSDPAMLPLYQETAKYARAIEQKYMPLISDTRKQLANTAFSSLPPSVVVDMRNMLIQDLHSQYADVAAMITDLNMSLSVKVGKPIDVTKIDWKKGADQFR